MITTYKFDSGSTGNNIMDNVFCFQETTQS